MGGLSESFIVDNLEKLFPGMTLVEINEVISNRYEVDLHLRDRDLTDVYIEIMPKRVKKRDVGNILNYYMMLSNIADVGKIRFILLAEEVGEVVRDVLEEFGVEIILFEELPINEEFRRFQLEELKNVLTPTEAEVLAHIKKQDCGIVDVQEIGDFFEIDGTYASKLLERLEKKRYLERIKPGRYLYIPLDYGYDERYPPMNALIVGSILTETYYYGYQTANRYHGFTSQFSPVKYICTTKSKRPLTWRSIKYKFVNLVESKFFGYKKTASDGCKIFVARPEKAVLDSLDKPEYCGGVPQVVSVIGNALTGDLKTDLLLKYLEMMGSRTVIQRLGYITEYLLQMNIINIDEEFIKSIESLLPSDVSNTFLGSVGRHGRRGTLNVRWHIIENIDSKELSTELEIR